MVYDLPFPLFALFLLKSLLLLLCLPHHSPYCLSLHILMQHPGNSLFAVKHQQRAVFLAVNLLCPVLRFLLLAGADGLPRFRLCSMAAMSLGNLSAASSPEYASDARSRFFSERSSSKSSVSVAILAASSRCRNTWTAESAFFSESRLRRS